MTQPLVTIMIPSRGRVGKLIKTLNQLRISASGKNYEIILMGDLDDAATMKFFDTVKNIKVIRSPRLGYSMLDLGYYARMEREANGEFVWIAGDDMLVYGDWFGELSKVPRTGFIVQPAISQLRESVYPRAEGQAFPIFPKFCWKQFQDTFPAPFDVNGDLLLRSNGWKTWFLEDVSMWHDRPSDEEIDQHRKEGAFVSLQWGEDNTRVAGMVRDVGPWRNPTEEEIMRRSHIAPFPLSPPRPIGTAHE